MVGAEGAAETVAAAVAALGPVGTAATGVASSGCAGAGAAVAAGFDADPRRLRGALNRATLLLCCAAAAGAAVLADLRAIAPDAPPLRVGGSGGRPHPPRC